MADAGDRLACNVSFGGDASARGNGVRPPGGFAEQLPAEDVEEAFVRRRAIGVVELLAVEMVGDGAGVIGLSVASYQYSVICKGTLTSSELRFLCSFWPCVPACPS